MGRPSQTSLFALGLLLLLSCAKPTEGCLDIRATNFNAAAEDPCCCTYPLVRLVISHAADSVFQSPDSIYTNDLGQAYRLLGTRFFLSDFVFYMRDFGPVEVSDTLLIARPDGSSVWVKDDVIQIQRSLSSYAIGTLVSSGWIDSLSFQIGLIPEMKDGVPTSFPADHPLALPLSGLYSEAEGFQFLATDHLPLIPGSDTLQWAVNQSVRITLPTDVFVSIGYHIDIPITINYLPWMAKEDISATQVISITDWLQRIALSFRYGNL